VVAEISADAPSPAGLSTGLQALGRAASDVETRHARRSLQHQLFGAGGPPTVDRYVVLRRLGAGGMGIVYLAHDPELDREVAVKVLRKSDDRRLMREAEALAKLTHPNVVQVFAVGATGERAFIVMELVRGQTLDAWQRAHRGTRRLLDIYLQVGEGLVAAHEAGLVHRDFKPQNVIVGDDGRPRVLDFGLARTADVGLLVTAPGSGESDSRNATAIGRPLTRRGAVLGTLAYMAPEQFRGEEATPLCDQYAFCLSLWEAVYGAQPFPTDSVARMMTAREDGELVSPPPGSRVPRWLRNTLARGLAPRPGARFPTLRRLLDEIRRRRDRRRRRAIAAGTGLAMATVAGVAVLAAPGEQRGCDPDPHALGGAWDEARRDEVVQALRATGLPGAPDVERVLLPKLDGWAEAWRDAWQEACEATRVHGEQTEAMFDLRMACLQRRRVELRALTGILVDADAVVVGNATSAFDHLPRPEGCAAGSVVAGRAIDPAIAPELEAIREALASVDALRNVGKHDDALVAGEPLLSRAHRAGDAQTVAEVELAYARVLHRLGREPQANASFSEAYWAATESGDDALAVESASELLETLVVDPHPRQEADRWRRIAETAAARLPDPELLRCELLMRYGRILQQAGDLGQALAALHEAVEIRRRRRGVRDPSLSFTLSYLGMMLTQVGDPETARSVHADAVSIAEEALGPHHTDLGRLLANAAWADAVVGDAGEAHAKLDRARTILEASGGGHAYDLGTIAINLALLTAELGRLPEAIGHAERAVEILQPFAGDPKLGGAYSVLAELQLDSGLPEDALVTAKRGLELHGTRLDERACEAHVLVAAILQRLGSIRDSEPHLEEADRCPDAAPQLRVELAALWCASSRPERAGPHVAALLARDPEQREELERRLGDCIEPSP
jgi:tetratricopeptide (TPR) repeat protein/predicted Ser/Thr protein kinase